MREDEGEPRTLMATVGLNPLPVLLSILTLKPKSVMLVASTRSDAEARRIRTALGEVHAKLQTRCPMVEITYCGAGDNLDSTRERFTEIAAVIEGGRFRLDYTGGTKPMAIAAILTHLDHHDGEDHDGGRWRTYVDDATGFVRSGEAGHPATGIDSRGLDLASIAKLHGFTLPIDPINLYSAPDHRTTNNLLTILDHVDCAIADSDARLRDNSSNAAEWKKLIADAAEPAATVLAFKEKWLDGNIAAANGARPFTALRGACRELGVARLVVEWFAARGFHRNDDWEFALGGEAKKIVDETGDALSAQPDLLIRFGHRVLAVEIKSNARQAVTLLGDRVAEMRWLFGSAVAIGIAGAVGVVATKENTQKMGTEARPGHDIEAGTPWSDVEIACRQLSETLPHMGKIHHWRIDYSDPAAPPRTALPDQSRHATAIALTAWFTAATASPSRATDRPIGVTAIQTAAAVATDATPLAVEAAVRTTADDMRSHTTTLLGIGSKPGFTTLNQFAKSVRLQPPPKRIDPGDAGEASTYAALSGVSLTRVLVTPGPKGTTAGLIRLARRAGAEILHHSLDGRVTVLDSGTTYAAAPVRWAGALAPHYVSASTQQLPSSCTAIIDALNQELCPNGEPTEASQTLQIFVPADSILPDNLTLSASTAAITRSVLIIAGTHGCASVYIHPHDGGKRFLKAVRTPSAHVSALIGDAHKPLLFVSTAIEEGAFAAFKSHQIPERWLPFGRIDHGADTATLDDAPAVIAHLFGATGSARP